MNIKFEVKMTKKAMFDFMLYTSYTSLSGIVGVIFGGVTLVLGIRQCMFGSYSTAATFFLFAAIFLIGNPLHLKARAAEQVMRSPMFQKPISYELNEEGIRISQDEQSVLNEWGDFRKAVSTGQSVIICNKGKSTDFSKRIPGRTVCGSSADDFYTYVSQESQYQTRQCKLGGRPEDDN